MLLQAAKDFNIDLSASYMVGDTDSDVQCGINAGCTPVRITDTPTQPMEFASAADFVRSVFPN